MTAKVIDLAEAIESRDQKRWDAEARALGFKDYSELAATEDADFEAAWEALERNCGHPDKRPGLGVCEHCAESFRR